MNFMENLSPDQASLLASLPYRAGLWISQSDQTGGSASDEEEAQTLASLITGYSEEVFGSETVQYVLSETLKRRNEWPTWEENLAHVESECERAVDILKDHVDPKEVSAFKKHIIEIAESVALAFREIGDDIPLLDKARFWFAYTAAKRRAAKTGEGYMPFEQFLNISLDERQALKRLATALGVQYF